MSGNPIDNVKNSTRTPLPHPSNDSLINSLYNLRLNNLGFVENSRTGNRTDFGESNLHTTDVNSLLERKASQSATTMDSSRVQGEFDIQQREVRTSSSQVSMNDRARFESFYHPYLLGATSSHGLDPHQRPMLALASDAVLPMELSRLYERQPWGQVDSSCGGTAMNGSLVGHDFSKYYKSFMGGNSVSGIQAFGVLPRQQTGTSPYPFIIHYSGANNIGILGTGLFQTPCAAYSNCINPELLGMKLVRKSGAIVNNDDSSRPDSTHNSNIEKSQRGASEAIPDVVLRNLLRLKMFDASLIEELDGRDMCVMAKHPEGFQYLLTIVASEDPLAIRKTVDLSLEVIYEILIDQTGSIIFQKLLESCNVDLLKEIIYRITNRADLLIRVANTKYGTRSVQKLLKLVKKCPEFVNHLTIAFSFGVHSLMTNLHGSLVVQLLTAIQGPHISVLYTAILELCLTLATNEKGCINLNKCITNSKSPHRESLLDKIADNSLCLSQHPFGNFVVQHVLALDVPSISRKMCKKLEDNFERLSLQKGGSHVVEKCLKSSGRDFVILKLVAGEKFGQVARDQYGNYVIQTALKLVEGELFGVLRKRIQEHSQSLQYHPYGRNVISQLNHSSGARSH